MKSLRAAIPSLAAVWLMLGGGPIACSVYDSGLLVQQHPDAVTLIGDDASTPNRILEDAGPIQGPDAPNMQRDAGSDGGGPITRCGDGEITGGEKCDISIAADQPGACPTSCPALAKCAPRQLNGSSCQTECVLSQLLCQSGDNCCPANCTASNDSDCSPKCGDGIVQQGSGETCEPGSSMPCPTKASDCDDKDPCTVDQLMGSASNCNATCVHTPVTTPKGGDGCCPSGANANTDSDCQPKCGNGVREGDEQCDGGQGCGPDCKITGQPAQINCLLNAKDDCERCACMNCTQNEIACRYASDQTKAMQCSAVIDCSRQNNCLGSPCYCGSGLICGFPFGPCKAQVEAAVGSSDAVAITNAFNDSSSTLGLAYAADSCRVMQCQSTCR